MSSGESGLGNIKRGTLAATATLEIKAAAKTCGVRVEHQGGSGELRIYLTKAAFDANGDDYKRMVANAVPFSEPLEVNFLGLRAVTDSVTFEAILIERR